MASNGDKKPLDESLEVNKMDRSKLLKQTDTEASPGEEGASLADSYSRIHLKQTNLREEWMAGEENMSTPSARMHSLGERNNRPSSAGSLSRRRRAKKPNYIPRSIDKELKRILAMSEELEEEVNEIVKESTSPYKKLGVKAESPSTSSVRRQQLEDHTKRLWKTMDEICAHSSLSSIQLSKATNRIEGLKEMDQEISKHEKELDALKSILIYESKYYLEKLRVIEDIVSAPVDDLRASQGQVALETSFSKNACKILYNDNKGEFQLVSAKLNTNSSEKGVK